MVWNIIGSISNAIAAICAVAAIVVTVWNFKSDRREQKKENLCIKLRELYKKTVIDSFLKIVDENISKDAQAFFETSVVVPFSANVIKIP